MIIFILINIHYFGACDFSLRVGVNVFREGNQKSSNAERIMFLQICIHKK